MTLHVSSRGPELSLVVVATGNNHQWMFFGGKSTATKMDLPLPVADHHGP